MTPREFFYLTDGLRWREEAAMQRTAWLAHLLLSAWVEDAPTVEQLLGKAPEETNEEALEKLRLAGLPGLT